MLRRAFRDEGGFTMMELLIVIAIIMLLAAILLPVVHRVKAQGRLVTCKNNMLQLHKAIIMYRDDYRAVRDNIFPDRLTKQLYGTSYIGYKESFLCPEDESEGHDGGKPNMAGVDQYAELDEHDKPGCLPLSYMYEFSGAECDSVTSWPWPGYLGCTVADVDTNGDGEASWGEVKWFQLRHGDTWLHSNTTMVGYPTSKFPMLRCFWHTSDPNSNKETAIVNLAFQGNVFISGAKWEEHTHH